tara:strand:- start:158 stop:3235 length:3078 start_codon:yes stop_codon:yes gene_type:complete
MKLLFRYLGILLCSLPLTGVFGQELSHAAEMKGGLALFKNEVRGILEQHCIECHGQGDLEGDFDMSTRGSLFESGFVGGSAAESDLVDSITHRFEPFMPHEGDKLDEGSIEAIARWIDLGAPYDHPLVEGVNLKNQGPVEVTDRDRDYWAYRPITMPDFPVIQNDLWPRNEIDHFVLNQLEERGLSPNEEAKRRTLIRRLFLNAVGLPPSLNEVAVFVGDFKPGAYERLVERVLNSKHFGERWARHWMDISRFAETMGFETDFDRPFAYHYRDFLIKVFNQNMPYDQFVRWQIAGDQLDPEDPLALIATGFLGAGVISTVITEKEFESARYDELDDMVSTIGAAFLGTTIGCARCHDHKYDPIPTKDYYGLIANFTRTVRTYIDQDPFADQFEGQLAKFDLEKDRLYQELARYEESVMEPRFESWLKEGSFDIPADRWIVLSPDTFESMQDAEMNKLWDESMLVQSQFIDVDNENLVFEFETSLQNLAALRMETLTHPLLPNQGPGGDYEGGFTLLNLTVEVQDLSLEEPMWKKVELESAVATSEKNDQSFSAKAIFGHVSQGWSISENALGKDQAIVIWFKEPLGFRKSIRIRVKLSSGLNLHQMVGRPRFSVTHDRDAPVEVSSGVSMPAYQGMLKLFVGRQPETLLDKERTALRRWFGREDTGWQIIWRGIQEHELNRPKTQKLRIMVATDTSHPIWHRSAAKGFPSFYEETNFLERGDTEQKGAVAQPGFLQVLMRPGSQFPSDSGRDSRKRFSHWLTDVEAGAGSLLARVFVNRVWYHYFGRGIVETPNDFGKQGGDPSHPELLEWLAADFVEHGWDIKRLHQQILTSATFRQDSEFDAKKSNLDMHNRWLWRYVPRRFEVEVIRDSLLIVSGLLDRTQFGPGTRDPDMLRRSIYFYIKRSALIPEMVLFDWPEHLVSIGRRHSTTIGPQALHFLNSRQTRKYAEGFAQRLASWNDLDELVLQAYLIAFGRFPKTEEIELGKQFLTTQASSYREKGHNPNLAIVDYCQSLFSLNEFVYIR